MAFFELKTEREMEDRDMATFLAHMAKTEMKFPYLPAVIIRATGENKIVGDALAKVFVMYAQSVKSPIVRLALASACQRLTVEQRKPIVLALLAHEEDKDDANLPLMDWYAAEPIVAADPAWAAEALAACKIPKVAEFIARRMSEK